jgi:hypothetical protein
MDDDDILWGVFRNVLRLLGVVLVVVVLPAAGCLLVYVRTHTVTGVSETEFRTQVERICPRGRRGQTWKSGCARKGTVSET